MAILETIKENIGVAGQLTADLAKKTAERIRLTDQIRRDKKEIRKLTYEIGQTYLRLHGDDCEEVYKEFVDGIALARIDIEEKRKQLAQLKEKPEPEAAEPEMITVADEEDWDDFFAEDAEEAGTEAASEEAAPEEAAPVEAALEETAETAETAEETEEADQEEALDPAAIVEVPEEAEEAAEE